MSAAVAQRGGCLKCGAMGHWARDCTAPKSQWLPRNTQDNTSSQQLNSGVDRNDPIVDDQDQNTNINEAPLGAAAAAKKKRQRPKLTFDLLKETAGLPDIYHNFPALFKQQFRGKGHEVSDLRRLLEMYKRWQDRIFPHGEFDHFIASLQNLGGKNIVKSELQDMRVNLLKVAENSMTVVDRDNGDNDDNREDEDAGLMAMAVMENDGIAIGGGNDNNTNTNNDDDNDDDEFIAMMGDTNTNTNQDDDNLDDEELLEMAGMMTQEDNGNDDDDNLDDEELLEMAMME